MKSIAAIVASVALLLVSGTYLFQTIQTGREQQARISAFSACAEKIPNDEKAIEDIVTAHSLTDITHNPTSYSAYPSFDRCLASKGYSRY